MTEATQLMRPLDLRVTTVDGAVSNYRTAPVDNWRAEKLTGRPIFEAVNTYSGWCALAYSCAVRAGDAYRTRKASTDEQAAFAAWLDTVADLEVITPDDEEVEPGPPVDSSASS